MLRAVLPCIFFLRTRVLRAAAGWARRDRQRYAAEAEGKKKSFSALLVLGSEVSKASVKTRQAWSTTTTMSAVTVKPSGRSGWSIRADRLSHSDSRALPVWIMLRIGEISRGIFCSERPNGKAFGRKRVIISTRARATPRPCACQVQNKKGGGGEIHEAEALPR